MPKKGGGGDSGKGGKGAAAKGSKGGKGGSAEGADGGKDTSGKGTSVKVGHRQQNVFITVILTMTLV